MFLGDLQGDEHQRPGQEPEVGDADFTEPQVPLAPKVFELDEVFVEELPFKFPRLLGRIPGQEQAATATGMAMKVRIMVGKAAASQPSLEDT